MKPLTQSMQKQLSYEPANKAAFHREAKKVLRKVAKSMNLSTGEYDVRSNMGGIAVSGEITLHTDNVYVQVSQPCFGTGNEVMYRKCKGRKDFCGEQNNFAPVEDLEHVNSFACRFLNIIN